ncbi:MAG TPA: hypothetical protein VMH79_01070 [Thermoanaerobaculia bacterium]|nr:hypothetical protein [Thermoanaerobaculia bacterium]
MRSLLRTLGAAALLGLGAACLFAQSSGGCPPQGDAKKEKVRKLNELRARTEEPSDDDYDDTADITALIAPGDDSQRWSNDTAVEITAFVVDVHDGGMTSANCHSADPADHDTILDLSPGAGVSDASHRLIAVITPQWRRLMASNRIDWSTRAIRAKFVQQYVTIRGWLLWNFEAAPIAVNTAPLAGASITRATAWEIHPVTGIELNDDSLEQQTRLECAPGLYARSKASSSAP